jgi:Ferric reductase like transmembrane component
MCSSGLGISRLGPGRQYARFCSGKDTDSHLLEVQYEIIEPLLEPPGTTCWRDAPALEQIGWSTSQLFTAQRQTVGMAIPVLWPRHIENFRESDSLQKHWGYASRAVPCTNDPGSCEYLGTVYHSHDLGMLYTFVMWAAIGGILFMWGIGRHFVPARKAGSLANEESGAHPQSSLYRLYRAVAAVTRKFLLPDASRAVFGRVTRLQIVILLGLTAYLMVFTFVDIAHKAWVTPVKDTPRVYSTRTGLGPWSNRIGLLAYALIPLSVMLASRESMLSMITRIPCQHFNFLHRWLGYIIYIQSTLYIIGWVVVEGMLYQPQPSVWNGFIAQNYMIWGVVATIFLSFLFFFSLPCTISFTGCEFFRKVHYVVAMLYVGTCWGSLVVAVVLADRLTCHLAYGSWHQTCEDCPTTLRLHQGQHI